MEVDSHRRPLCVQVEGGVDWEEDGRVSSERSEKVGDRLRRESKRTSLWMDRTWDGGHQKPGRTSRILD